MDGDIWYLFDIPFYPYYKIQANIIVEDDIVQADDKNTQNV